MELSPRIKKLGIDVEVTPMGFRLSDRENGLLLAELPANMSIAAVEAEAKLYLIEQKRLSWMEW